MPLQPKWAQALLRSIRAPATPSNLAVLSAWQRAEGGGTANSANYNPLNTTQPAAGAGSINSVGVRSYRTPQQGISATAQTLLNGRYGNIVQGLRSGASARQIATAVEQSPWGTGGGVLRVLGQPAARSTGPASSAVSGGSLREMASAPVGQPEAFRSPHPFSDFARNMIASFGQTRPGDAAGMLGAIMQLRRDTQPGLSGALSQMRSDRNQGSTLAVQPSSASSSGAATGFDPTFASNLRRLERAVGGLSVTSGFRSNEEQTKLFNAAVQKYGSVDAARKWVAPPGHSNHNKGLAADLSGNLELAHKLAPQFGLTFPMSWEPWHVEPVGIR